MRSEKSESKSSFMRSKESESTSVPWMHRNRNRLHGCKRIGFEILVHEISGIGIEIDLMDAEKSESKSSFMRSKESESTSVPWIRRNRNRLHGCKGIGFEILVYEISGIGIEIDLMDAEKSESKS
uniref:Uncharacterized protein n=1 Tax=Romanomermis culicivorax TaxID=13658 RepID=A0A915HUG7_ROMCU